MKNRPVPDLLHRSGKPLGALGRTVQEARRQLRERGIWKFYNLHAQPNPREKTRGSKLAQKRNSHFPKICTLYYAKAKPTGFPHPVHQPGYVYMCVHVLWLQSVVGLFWGDNILWDGLEDTQDRNVNCVMWQRDRGSGKGVVWMYQRETSPDLGREPFRWNQERGA